MERTCSEKESLSSVIIPRILIDGRRVTLGVGGGGIDRFLEKMISDVFVGLSLRLHDAAHEEW